MESETRPMEIVCHDLDCHCNRCREWIKVNGEWHPIEYSVDDPNDPPMSEEERQKLAEIILEFIVEK